MVSKDDPLILLIPIEVAQRIICFCHPCDVAAFSRSCRAAHALVYHPTEQHLWRSLYLAQSFDNPDKLSEAREKLGLPRAGPTDWKAELTKRSQAELTLFRGPVTPERREEALRTVVQVIEESSLALWHKGSSRNISWLRRILRHSLLLNNLYSLSDEEQPAQLYAQLRSYVALAVEYKGDRSSSLHLLHLEKRDKSRAYVYDLRHYTSANNWGPFLPNGSVNWIHVEHLINVASLNIAELPGSWTLTRPPSCLTQSRPFTDYASEDNVKDWAGVEGTWRRYVCFMDYRDLFAFNFTGIADGPRHPNFFKDARFREATRLIEVQLRIVPASDLRHHPTPARNASVDQTLAPLCFTGSSRGVDGRGATVEGCVVLGKDKIARWYFMSIYDSHPQWSSNGVQIGGLGSSMGVVGIWTTTHHEQDDPVGPFWLWKVDDNATTHLMDYT